MMPTDVKIMGNKTYLLLLFILTTVAILHANQGTKASPSKEPAPLTREEKEILADREILENLDMLQNLDKCRLLDLFLEIPDTEKKASAAPEAKKKEQGKK